MSASYTEIECTESTSFPVTCTLKDESEAAIASASIDSIVLTLIDDASGETINSRSNQSVLNANDCTMHATSGLFTWNVKVADTAIVGTPDIGDYENHRATFTVTWATVKQQHWEVMLRVKNLRSVPQGGVE